MRDLLFLALMAAAYVLTILHWIRVAHREIP